MARPAKKVIILARSQETESVLRFILKVRSFNVFATSEKSQLEKELNRIEYECLLVEFPCQIDVSKWKLGYRIPVIGFGGGFDGPNSVEDNHVSAGKDFMNRLIFFIKLVCKKKRGRKTKDFPDWRKDA